MSTETKTTVLKLSELFTLEAELLGYGTADNSTIITQGLVNQKLPLRLKYQLNKLVHIIAEEKKQINDLRTGLLKELGKPDMEDTYSISPTIEEIKQDGEKIQVTNPAITEFNKQFTELLATTKEIVHPKFLMANFGEIETTDQYDIFYKLID